ncbi:hypothetical protein R50073_02420 [Maricurvus nonylphenolicus]|uniref:hypothetical protein n=1 Tax=Maricurvus nonylphenolicus TaxID=1008307 RepID=UPI0036F38FD3
MAFGLSFIAAPWRAAWSILLLSIVMMLIYDMAFFLPLGIRNLAGVTLFICIMCGAAISYGWARAADAGTFKAIKIGLFIPFLWHLKEIVMAGKIFGVAEGIYAGLQGFYLIYYALMILSMGAVHLVYELYRCYRGSGTRYMCLASSYFLMPMLGVCFIEWLVYHVAGLDLFMFQGYLQGYRYLFM